MKKIIAATLLSLLSTASLSDPSGNWPVEIHGLARSYAANATRDHILITTGDYWVEANNFSDSPQSISMVYKHCTQGDPPVCDQGEYVHVIEAHTVWKQQFTLHQARLFAYGKYSVGDAINIRVDATGKHYEYNDRNYVWSN